MEQACAGLAGVNDGGLLGGNGIGQEREAYRDVSSHPVVPGVVETDACRRQRSLGRELGINPAVVKKHETFQPLDYQIEATAELAVEVVARIA